MRRCRLLIYLSLLLAFPFMVSAQEVLQWRGADRNGTYPGTNLLTSWPEAGPDLLWEFDGLGNGYGSPVITSKNIFINGEIDTVNYLFALDLSGKFLWKARIGKEWMQNYPGDRSTPTIAGDLIYVTAGWGTVACIEMKTGKTIWSVDMIKDLHGRINRFGLSESVLADGDKVFCMPGGADTNVVALDRFSGKILWTCKGLSQIPAYCSPQLVKLPQRDILVTFSKSALLGIDTKDGKLLWSHKQDGEGDVHINTPWFENGFLYYITGDGNGSVKLKLNDDGTEITEVWRNQGCDNTMGGFIKINDYLYTASYGRRYWYSEETNTGKITDSLKFDKGVTVTADGMLYLYNEKGQVGLVKPGGAKMDLVSSFKITKGSKAHYAHPVINNGILYVRHGKSLLAYDIRKKL
ncbi:MAG: PQQ-binding-like beta-propeller repeat protein [Bacteroidetes bacterium]|nr:PQQ-binding-like beta-propeller repeat protein [Bacteroidota bacterium]